jgi:GxxExxY protein
MSDLGYRCGREAGILLRASRRFTAGNAGEQGNTGNRQVNGFMHIDEVTGRVVSAAIRVHSRIGPGLLESSYEACLRYELTKCGLRVASQVPVPLIYDEVKLDIGYRIDLLVENEVVIEIKALESIMPVHEAQLLSHMRLSGRRVGFLMNFHVKMMRDGIKRMVDQFPEGGYDC